MFPSMDTGNKTDWYMQSDRSYQRHSRMDELGVANRSKFVHVESQ